LRRYHLTSGAEADVAGILSYTLDHWGAEQAERYAEQLETCLRDLAARRNSGKIVSDDLDGVLCRRCEHHYVFYTEAEDALTVLAALHETMNLVARLGDRLGG
jgi:toxin ParE1/3/4